MAERSSLDELRAIASQHPATQPPDAKPSSSLEELRSLATAGRSPVTAQVVSQKQDDDSGYGSLLRKAKDQISYRLEHPSPVKDGKLSPEFFNGPFQWNNLTPNEKRAAIAIGAMLYPGTLSATISKIGITGLLGAITRYAGYAAEGAALAVATQAAGNVATGRPVTEGVGENAVSGALGSTVLGGIGEQLPRVSKYAKQLMDAKYPGVRRIIPTVGQSVDKSNMAGKVLSDIEEKASSYLGPFAKGPRARAQQEYLDATLARANPPGYKPLEGTTQEKIGSGLKVNLGSEYDNAAAKVGNVALSGKPYTDWEGKAFSSILDAPIDQKMKDELENYLIRKLNSKISLDKNGNQIITSDALKELESDIGDHAISKLKASGTGYDSEFHEVGRIAAGIKSGIKDMRGQLSPEAKAIYDRTDPLYAQYKTFEKAAQKPGAAGEYGDFTPRQALAALPYRQNPPPPGSLQDWLQAGAQVFKNQVPDSGTAGRLLPYYLMGGSLASGAYGNTQAPGSDYAQYLAYLMGIGALGTRIGQRGLLGMMNASQAAAPYVRNLGALYPYDQSNGQPIPSEYRNSQ